MITGSLFIRKSSKKVYGRKLLILSGVVAISDDMNVDEEMLYVTVGQESEGEIILHLSDPHPPSIDISGMRVDQILTSEIWKV